MFTLAFVNSCDEDDYDPDYPDPSPSTYTLTVWSNFSGSPISVYINGIYRGEITRYYSSSPGCEASGCVTVYFSTSGSYTLTASDGDHNWNASGYVSNSCTTMNLHL